MPDSFADPKNVIKSYIPAANAPIRIDVQEGHNQVATVSRQRMKHGRPNRFQKIRILGNKKGAENDNQNPNPRLLRKPSQTWK